MGDAIISNQPSQSPRRETSTPAHGDRNSRRYRAYLLTLLTALLTFAFVDRLALAIVMQDIKVDLQLSDTQLGFLTGIAFALFYAVMGLPLAHWADRGNRTNLVTLTTGLWSVGVVLSGLVANFWQLLLIRVGIAVGEAGCLPAGQSLIADYFARSERARATSIYMLASPLSLVVGYLAAGWLNELVGWRTMFILLGIPGFLLAILAYTTLREPRRERLKAAPPSPQSTSQVLATLLQNKTFVVLLIAYSVHTLFNSGLLQWQPTFFVRTHGLSTVDIGTWFAIVCGIGGLSGTYLGGEWANKYAQQNERLQLAFVALGYGALGIAKAAIFLSPTPALAFLWLGVAMFGGCAANGPLFGVLQTLVPGHMRATAVAVVFFFANLVGSGLGPLAVGIASDALQPHFGSDSLRYAMLALCVGCVLSSAFILRARKTVQADLTKSDDAGLPAASDRA